VCGLRWSADGELASGGNDNKLFIWDSRLLTSTNVDPSSSSIESRMGQGMGQVTTKGPLYRWEHKAAVKALGWSPQHRGLLASGGGTQDKRLRVWSTKRGGEVGEVDTGAQVRRSL
jgi:cell division cycle 20-like protein 1, cofactor of APC complex